MGVFAISTKRDDPRGAVFFRCAPAFALSLVACVGDSTTNTDGGQDATSDVTQSDAQVDAGGPCDPSKPFGTPVLMPNVNTTNAINGASFAPDELTLYLATRTGADSGTDYDLYSAARASTSVPFAAPTVLPSPPNTTGIDWNPWISSDALTLYYASNSKVQVSVRTSTSLAFPAGQVATNINAATGTFTEAPSLTADGKRMFVSSDRDGLAAIYEATLGGSGFGVPAKVAELASPQAEGTPVISADGLTIYFMSTRLGTLDIFTATRATLATPFSAPAPVTELNSSGQELPAWLSVDECRLYFMSDTQGTTQYELYLATKPK